MGPFAQELVCACECEQTATVFKFQVLYFYRRPVTVKRADIHQDRIPFPRVTICNHNPIKRMKENASGGTPEDNSFTLHDLVLEVRRNQGHSLIQLNQNAKRSLTELNRNVCKTSGRFSLWWTFCTELLRTCVRSREGQ